MFTYAVQVAKLETFSKDCFMSKVIMNLYKLHLMQSAVIDFKCSIMHFMVTKKYSYILCIITNICIEIILQ